MDINQRITDIAKRSMAAATDDLPGLVELRDDIESLSDHDELHSAIEAIQKAVGLLDQIVLGEVEDVNATIGALHEVIDRIQASASDSPVPSSNEQLNEIDADLLAAWVSGSIDTVAEIEALILECNDDVEVNVAEIRRRVHTIKGECGVVGAQGSQKLFHEAESAIDRAVEQGNFPADDLLSVVDWFRHLLDRIADGGDPGEPPDQSLLDRIASFGMDSEPAGETAADAADSPSIDINEQLRVEIDETVTEFIAESNEHIANAERALLELEAEPENSEHINTVFRAFHTIKGVAGYINLVPIVELAHKSEHLLDMVRRGERRVDQPLLDVILASCDTLTVLIQAIDGSSAADKRDFHSLISRLDAIERGESEAAVAPSIPRDASKPDAPAAPSGSTPRKAHVEQTAKVSTLRLDSLVDLVGELVIGHQMVVQDPEVLSLKQQNTQRNIVHVGKIIRDLQGVAMSLRMVTLRGAFQKMARLVRDLSSKSDKNVRLIVEGEDTELDRSVVEELGDPLVHLIRNACDHGLESPADRVAAGKPETGTVTLRAFHKGGAIVIEVEDDGRGLNRDKLIAKAIERGVIPPERDPSEMSDSEAFQLIFAPGFSTAAQVTDVSGRGVGMDVVRRNIEALRGKVEIRSTLGVGSTFVLSLPLTLAIIDGMVVRVGDQRYVIPTLSIEQSFCPVPEQLHTMDGGRGEMAMVRGDLLPIHRLASIFETSNACASLCDGLLLAVEAKSERACIAVDEILGQQQVVIKSLGDGIDAMPGISGGAILGDGRIAPILDIGVLLDAVNSTAV